MSVTGGCRRELPRSRLTCSPPLIITSPIKSGQHWPIATNSTISSSLQFYLQNVKKRVKQEGSTCHFRAGHFRLQPGQGAEWPLAAAVTHSTCDMGCSSFLSALRCSKAEIVFAGGCTTSSTLGQLTDIQITRFSIFERPKENVFIF
jgi:hypothetical protein